MYICVYMHIHIYAYIHIYVMGVMKMGNTVPRTGLKPTSLAFQASVLPLHHVGSLMSPLSPHPPDYAAPCLRESEVSADYYI